MSYSKVKMCCFIFGPLAMHHFFLKLLPNLFAKDNLSDTSDFNVFIGCKQKMFCKCAVYRQVQFGCHDTDVTKSFYKVYF